MITREEMQKIDRDAIDHLHVPSIVLMENAAIHFVYRLDLSRDNYLVLASVGNNGGDGLAITRQLMIRNKKVKTIVIGNLEKATPDFLINYNILKQLGAEPLITGDFEIIEEKIAEADVIIDALFGIGMKTPLRDPYPQLINLVNRSERHIISVDIPSGLDANTGLPLGTCIKADKTVTMHAVKQGLVKGKEFTGELSIASIGIPIE